jgi:hypothetical protein
MKRCRDTPSSVGPGGEDLQRDVAVPGDVQGTVDDRHPAPADLPPTGIPLPRPRPGAGPGAGLPRSLPGHPCAYAPELALLRVTGPLAVKLRWAVPASGLAAPAKSHPPFTFGKVAVNSISALP